MGKLFGTDGVRGEAGVFPLDAGTVQAIGASVARQFTERLGRTPRFITGRDTRESGTRIERAFQSGLAKAGGVGESAGVITTPGVAYLTGKFGFDAGIVISASHNPYQDNGIKIFLPDGKKIDEAVECRIEADIADAGAAKGTPNVEISFNTAYQDAYLDHLAGEFPDLELKNFKLVVDCANGAASDLAPQLFQGFGAEVSAINDRPDGRNINENSGSLHLEGLQAKVVQAAADFGVAFDGDADRALFVDEKGSIIDGDMVLWVLGKYLLDHGKLKDRTIVATVMSNIGLEIALASKDIKLTRTAVGDKYVLDELLRSGSAIGGEQSGHIILPQKSLVGDGMITTLFMLQAVREAGSSFSSLTAGFTRYPQVLVNVKVREKQPFENVNEIAEEARRIEAELDGSGRLLLRYSGTENLARVMIEGKDQKVILQQANRLADVIRTHLGTIQPDV